MAGLFCVIGLAFVAAFGERIAPYEPIYYVVEHGTDPRPYDPGQVFPFGSDVLGRDMFSLVLAGARTTLSVVVLAGLARVVAGIAIATVGTAFRPARLLIETAADLAAAVPATLLALLLIKAFVRGDTSIPVVILALLVVGWAGPYRVIRAETDRLARAPFIEGAALIGVGRVRLFICHHLPHLVPVLATNLSQQIVAALVLLAELGVLGVIVSAVRSIDVTESLSVVRTGPPNQTDIPDSAEWGAMLSSARTVEILWVTRWVIFVPGAAFALTAAAVAVIGYAAARRYARRNLFADAHGAAAIVLVVAFFFVASALVPERYAAAREWATAARASIARSGGDAASELAAAGLSTKTVTQRQTTISRPAAGSLTVAGRTATELFPAPLIYVGDAAARPDAQVHLRSLVSDGVGGGGSVDAPLVYAARGIVPPTEERPPVIYTFGKPPLDLAAFTKNYPSDYAGIDVRGKIVLLTRFKGVDAGARGFAAGFSPLDAISDAIARGAAGVIVVDPAIGLPNAVKGSLDSRGAPNPYTSIEAMYPPRDTHGVPVMIVDASVAESLFGPLGVAVGRALDYDDASAPPTRSDARELGVTARIDVPLQQLTTSVTSLVAEVPGFSDATGRIVVWAEQGRDSASADAARRDVLTSFAHFAMARHAPFVFVYFDPRLGSDAVREFLRQRRPLVVFVLDRLDRTTLRFSTANGDLIPAVDLYAERSGAQHELTRRTLPIDAVGSPVPDLKTVVVTTGGDPHDARADVAALLGYAAGRLALGAPEVGR